MEEKQNGPGTKRAWIVRRVIMGVAGFLQKEKRILDKDAIKLILPHREDKLLLDRVIITAKKIIGEFTVTEKVCKGHKFNGQLIFRGVDIVEMAAQLLGVWAAQYSEFENKMAYLKSIKGEVKFSGMIVPSNLLTVEISVKENEKEPNPRIEIKGRPGRLIQKVVGENFTARVEGKLKSTISRIELIIVDPL